MRRFTHARIKRRLWHHRRRPRHLTASQPLAGHHADPKQRIYYANHSSHGDFVLLWASLPPEVRRRTRPVAGADYWNKAGLRSYVINKVFNGVLVDRQRSEVNANPLEPLDRALDGGDSLIIFPEGTRNLDDEVKAVAIQERYLPPVPGPPGRRAGAGLAGQPQPGHAWAACCRCRCSAP